MQSITTIGLDIAKSVFQVHGVDAKGHILIRRPLKRRYVLAFFQRLPPCLVGIEACASSHHWSRELQALHGPSRRFAAPRRYVRSSGVKPTRREHRSTDAFDPEPSLTLRGGDRRIQGLQCSTILAEDDCDHPSNQPRNVCAHIPNTYGRCRGLSSLRGSRLAAIARV